ncbi:MAG TPA: hypothetical protein VFT43_09150 [Candidatus Polarisedimenticolia bacterium]|nr:hypothetical protein [Candidatus Polarisedimenticolia bacterium]
MIVPFLRPPMAVIAYLQNPRERFWGVIRSLEGTGIVLQGVDLESFDDCLRQCGERGDPSSLTTIFFPMHRVEKVLLDTATGSIPSLTRRLEERVGQPLPAFLGLGKGPRRR